MPPLNLGINSVINFNIFGVIKYDLPTYASGDHHSKFKTIIQIADETPRSLIEIII